MITPIVLVVVLLIVRSILVTALTLDLARWIWWPSRLAREPGDDAAGRQPGRLSQVPMTCPC